MPWRRIMCGASIRPPSHEPRLPNMILRGEPVTVSRSRDSGWTHSELGFEPPFIFHTRNGLLFTLRTNAGSIDALGWQTSGPRSLYGPSGLSETATVTHGRPYFLRAL